VRAYAAIVRLSRAVFKADAVGGNRDTAAMRLPGRRSGLTPLDEAAAYARCHGSRDNDVRIVKLPPRRPRYDVLTTGEDLRRLFERRLDAREPEGTS
jgi:hypothetical protein